MAVIVPVIKKEFVLTPASGNAQWKLTDQTDYTLYGLINSNVKGNFLLTSPRGVIHNGLSWSSPDITRGTTDSYSITPPLDNDGVPQMGDYDHEYTIQITLSITAVDQATDYFQVTEVIGDLPVVGGTLVVTGTNAGTYTIASVTVVGTDTRIFVTTNIPTATVDGTLSFYNTFDEVEYDFYWCKPAVDIDVTVDCINARLQSRDNSTYEITYAPEYTALSPTTLSRTHTIKYPSGIKPTKPADIVRASVTVVTPDLYTKTFTSIISTELVYTMPSGLLVNYTAAGTEETVVTCNNDLCEVSSCIYNAIDEYYNCLGTNPINIQVKQQTFAQMVGYTIKYLTAQQCGNVDDMAAALTSLRIVARSTDCGCQSTDASTTPQKIVGYSSISGSGGAYILTSSGNGIEITETITGSDTEWEVTLNYSTIASNLLADDAETIAGLIDNKFISPLKLKVWWADAQQQFGVDKIITTDGSGNFVGTTKGTAFNGTFGVDIGEIVEIGATLTGPGPAYFDAAGKLTPTGTPAGAPTVLYNNNTRASSASTGNVDLMAYTMPANTIATDGSWLEITAEVNTTAGSSAALTSFDLNFGSQAIDLKPYLGIAGRLYIRVEINRVSAVLQRVRIIPYQNANPVSVFTPALVNFTEDLAAPVDISISGANVAITTSISAETLRVEKHVS